MDTISESKKPAYAWHSRSRTCVIKGCTNGDYKLSKWRED